MFVTALLFSGCGVLYSPLWAYRESGQDWSLHLFLPEEGRVTAALRGAQGRKSHTSAFLLWKGGDIELRGYKAEQKSVSV